MNNISHNLIAYAKEPKQKALAKHLQSKTWRAEPKGSPLAVALAQVSDLLGVLKKFSAFDELRHCVDLGRRVYESSLDWLFLGSVLYFDVSDPETGETPGSICLELGRASGMHPLRCQALEWMCQSRLGFYVHQGQRGELVSLRDLWTGTVHQVASGYTGQTGELWLVRLVNGDLLDKPNVIRQPNLALWRDFAEHHSDPIFLKHPAVWDQWLEFARKGFSQQSEAATFLKVEPEVRQPVAPGTMSLSQRWSPAVIQEAREAPRRPRLLALADEESGQILAFDQQLERQEPAQILAWLRSQPVQPQVLWLDDSALCAYVAEHWLEGRCELRETLPAVDQALKGLALRMESAGPSLTDTLSEREALAFFQEARRFFEKAPWERIGSDEVLIFQWGDQEPWGAVVMGSGGQEYGLALFDHPDRAVGMISGEHVLPLVGFSLSEEWLVSARDLQFLEHHGLRFPGDTYPWLVHQPPDSLPLTRELCQRVQWLLTWVPELAASGEAVQQPDGVLARMDIDEPDEGAALAMLVPLFLGAWGKRSQVAEVLAGLFCEFLSYLVIEHGISSAQMEDALEALVPIGDQYLRLHGRKRSLVLEFFMEPGQDKLRMRLARFLEERF
ncbi:MAG: hypothetical protein KF760_34550 [Candidatus Eremiobacteraeota bacterium]|nr:hypothetical protein [Candidatus Eremiobacteraeota bacterium]MCW5868709.1 hypothetical protein [Candidatus Eremiobacteraeota bacterium]